MAVTPYKVLAEEVNGTDLQYPTEILMSAANDVFAPTSASGPVPANTADNGQSAIQNAQALNNTYFASSVTQVTCPATTTTFQVDGALSVTPALGTYAIFFSGDVNTTGVNNQGDIQLFVDGVGLGESLRSVSANTALLGVITLSTNAIRTPVSIVDKYSFNGTQVLTVRYRVNPATSGNGTFQLNARTLLLMQTALT